MGRLRVTCTNFKVQLRYTRKKREMESLAYTDRDRQTQVRDHPRFWWRGGGQYVRVRHSTCGLWKEGRKEGDVVGWFYERFLLARLLGRPTGETRERGKPERARMWTGRKGQCFDGGNTYLAQLRLAIF